LFEIHDEGDFDVTPEQLKETAGVIGIVGGLAFLVSSAIWVYLEMNGQA